jgi:hypothetical protein
MNHGIASVGVGENAKPQPEGSRSSAPRSESTNMGSSLRYVFQESSQRESGVSAKRERNAGIQCHEHISSWRQIKFLDPIKIYHRTSMHAQEPFRVKLRLQFLHRLPQKMTSGPHVKAYVIAGRLYPIDVFRSDQEHSMI